MLLGDNSGLEVRWHRQDVTATRSSSRLPLKNWCVEFGFLAKLMLPNITTEQIPLNELILNID